MAKKSDNDKFDYVPGQVDVTFNRHVTVESAEKFLAKLGLRIVGSLKVCGRGPMSCTVQVQIGKEKAWVKKLKKKHEVLQAEEVLCVGYLDNVVESLKKRFNKK